MSFLCKGAQSFYSVAQENRSRLKSPPRQRKADGLPKLCLARQKTVPQWLLDMYPIPPGGCIHHTRFRDTSLPLFQAKLQNAKIFEGQKQSCSFSMLRFRDSIQSLFRGNNTSAEEQHQRELQPGSECGAAEHEDQPGKNHACETEEYGTSLFLHLVLVDTSIETD